MTDFNGFLLRMSEMPVNFSEKLFHRIVDYTTVYSDGRVEFIFCNCVEIEVYCICKFAKN